MKQIPFLSVEHDRESKKEKDISAIDLQEIENDSLTSPSSRTSSNDKFQYNQNDLEISSEAKSSLPSAQDIEKLQRISSTVAHHTAPETQDRERTITSPYESNGNIGTQSPGPSSMVARIDINPAECNDKPEPSIAEHPTGSEEIAIEARGIEQDATYERERNIEAQSPGPSSMVARRDIILAEGNNNHEPSITEHPSVPQEIAIETSAIEEYATYEPERNIEAQSPIPFNPISPQPIILYARNTQQDTGFSEPSANTEPHNEDLDEEGNLDRNDLPAVENSLIASDSPTPSTMVAPHPTAQYEESRLEVEPDDEPLIEYWNDGSVRILKEYPDYSLCIYTYSSNEAYENGEPPISHIVYNAEGDVISSYSNQDELVNEEFSSSESTQTYVSDDSQHHEYESDGANMLLFANNPQTEEFDSPNSTALCSGSCTTCDTY